MTEALAIAAAAAVLFPSLPAFHGLSLRDLCRTSTGLENFPPFHVWPDLAVTARMARDVVGEDLPRVFSSAYRSPAVNAAVGGVTGSRHQAGRAIDIVAPDAATYQKWEQAARVAGFSEVLQHDSGRGWHLHLGWGKPYSAARTA